MHSTSWTYVAACLIVPVAWGFAVHLLFERFGSRRPGSRRLDSQRAPAGRTESDSGAGVGGVDPDDDLAPEYPI